MRHLTCQDCRKIINTYNTNSVDVKSGRMDNRCGKCYLAWKKAERKRKGLL